MCITDDDYERSKAFGFLNEVKKKFTLQYGERVYTALPYAMNSDFNATMMAQMKVVP
jgi:vesicle-associated membrane protein 7